MFVLKYLMNPLNVLSSNLICLVEYRDLNCLYDAINPGIEKTTNLIKHHSQSVFNNFFELLIFSYSERYMSGNIRPFLHNKSHNII